MTTILSRFLNIGKAKDPNLQETISTQEVLSSLHDALKLVRADSGEINYEEVCNALLWLNVTYGPNTYYTVIITAFDELAAFTKSNIRITKNIEAITASSEATIEYPMTSEINMTTSNLLLLRRVLSFEKTLIKIFDSNEVSLETFPFFIKNNVSVKKLTTLLNEILSPVLDTIVVKMNELRPNRVFANQITTDYIINIEYLLRENGIQYVLDLLKTRTNQIFFLLDLSHVLAELSVELVNKGHVDQDELSQEKLKSFTFIRKLINILTATIIIQKIIEEAAYDIINDTSEVPIQEA